MKLIQADSLVFFFSLWTSLLPPRQQGQPRELSHEKMFFPARVGPTWRLSWLWSPRFFGLLDWNFQTNQLSVSETHRDLTATLITLQFFHELVRALAYDNVERILRSGDLTLDLVEFRITWNRPTQIPYSWIYLGTSQSPKQIHKHSRKKTTFLW